MRMAAFIVTVFISTVASAGEHASSVFRQPEAIRPITGNVQVDFFGQKDLGGPPLLQEESAPALESGRKSPWLAAGLSLIVPGAGEFYAESYWKSALFLAIDVAAWAIAYNFDKKGDKQTDFFKGYANQHWSVVQYAQYTYDHYVPENQKPQYAGLIKPGTAGLPPWQRVDWNVLNAMERYIGTNVAEGKFYSHSLPPYDDQQYYELIGKYKQFNQGWDDAPPSFNYSEPVTPNFTYYSGEFSRADDYYSSATTYVTIALVNHALSAADAAWSAASHNKSLHASMRYQQVPVGLGVTYVPAARLDYSF
ncbi:MAG: hypothetical protein HY961_22350 [Ignavibacteriae bacterium]|nr:hypothetical protein [Ignavibacteriota bacterium]